MTLALNVQDPLAASAAPERLMLVSAGLAVIRPPPQLPVRPLGVATANPDGSTSVKLIPLNELAFGFAMVKLRLVVPFSGMVSAPNAFWMLGGEGVCAEATAVDTKVPNRNATAQCFIKD
jgi:hypothetical protein